MLGIWKKCSWPDFIFLTLSQSTGAPHKCLMTRDLSLGKLLASVVWKCRLLVITVTFQIMPERKQTTEINLAGCYIGALFERGEEEQVHSQTPHLSTERCTVFCKHWTSHTLECLLLILCVFKQTISQYILLLIIEYCEWLGTECQ